jgi:hypothetical protein
MEVTTGSTWPLTGQKKNSLVNYLANLYPNLYYSPTDVWGYCTTGANPRPVMVFPVERQTRFSTNTLSVPAGVFIVTGSATGTPNVSYRANPGNLPGPVYPKSVAQTQRDMVNWAAGRAKYERGLFGFTPTTDAAQAGNTSEYLLRSVADGHLYWVTPLTLANSQSQLFVAYSLVRADSVNPGKLNSFMLYALADSDSREISVAGLNAYATTWMKSNGSNLTQGFFTGTGANAGSLIEYTPATGNMWRVFGEQGGQVNIRLDVPGNYTSANHIEPTLVSLNGATTPVAPTGPATKMPICGNDRNTLTQAQKWACVKFLVGGK